MSAATTPTTTAAVSTTATAATEHEEPAMTAAPAPTLRAPEHAEPVPTRPRWAAEVGALLRSEWIKASTVRTNKILLAASAVVGLLIAGASAVTASEGSLTVAEAFVFPTLLTTVLAAIAGIVLFTSEVQHGTLAAALTAHPSRWPVAAAKACAAAGFGLLLGGIGLVAGFAGALVGGLEVGDTSGMAATVGWALLYATGSALLGLGVGMAVRHSAGAISGLLIWWLVLEGTVVSLAPPSVVRFVPFDAGARTLGIETDMDRPEVVANALPNVAHASIFWAYVAAALVIGTILLLRRDAD